MVRTFIGQMSFWFLCTHNCSSEEAEAMQEDSGSPAFWLCRPPVLELYHLPGSGSSPNPGRCRVVQERVRVGGGPPRAEVGRLTLAIPLFWKKECEKNSLMCSVFPLCWQIPSSIPGCRTKIWKTCTGFGPHLSPGAARAHLSILHRSTVSNICPSPLSLT